jgi:single-strand DNA-binding protein
MCYFGIAVGRTKKINEEWKEVPSFFNFNLFGKKAEGVYKYLVKGQAISLEGHLEEDRWSKDGVSHSKMVVAVDKIRIIGSVKKKEDSGSQKEESPENSDEEKSELNGEEEYPDNFTEIDTDFDLARIEGDEIP